MDSTERELQVRQRLLLRFAAWAIGGGEHNLPAGYLKLVLAAFCPFFGPADAATQAALLAITDPERWERIADHIVADDAAGWDDLLATP